MKGLKENIYLKLGVIVVIILLLLIPTAMIRSLIHERESTQNESISEVSAKWGTEQRITGPVLSIPYSKWVKQLAKNNASEKLVEITDYIHFLPENLKIDGQINPNKRKRGIYEVVVYDAQLTISGSFKALDLSLLGIDSSKIDFAKAELALGLDDLRGIEEQLVLNWNGEKHAFNPGISSKDMVRSGLHAPLKIDPMNDGTYTFSVKLNIRGSQRLYFTPLGKISEVKMVSDWKNPSFNGAFLPSNYDVTESGFQANWKVLHLNRNYPQTWTGSSYKVSTSAFGIDLLIPVDNYQKSYRSIKYAILFIVLTFLVFFFIEVLNKRFIHPVQYVLVGLALIIFYTLLLSISEHIHFNGAFLISALATLSLITAYVRSILKSLPLAFMLSGILTVLYTFIFVIIQLQDYALLFGSIGLFLILALVMYFSRKIDWYQLQIRDNEDKS